MRIEVQTSLQGGVLRSLRFALPLCFFFTQDQGPIHSISAQQPFSNNQPSTHINWLARHCVQRLIDFGFGMSRLVREVNDNTYWASVEYLTRNQAATKYQGAWISSEYKGVCIVWCQIETKIIQIGKRLQTFYSTVWCLSISEFRLQSIEIKKYNYI